MSWFNWFHCRKCDQLQEELDEALLINIRYYQLLFVVENKYPNETRHETALRYITEKEQKKGNENV